MNTTAGKPRNVLIVTALLAVACFLGCSDSTANLNRKALDSLNRGDYAQAEKWLMLAIKQDPANRTLRRNLVEVFFRQEKWDDAIRQLKTTLSIAGLESDLELRTTLAIAYTMAGENKMASNLLRSLIEEAPDNEYLLYLDGITATAPRRAVDSLTKAIELNPDRKESYLALARAQAYAGETESARETLKKAEERFGPSSEAALYEVSLYLREGDMDSAREVLARIESEFAEDPRSRLFKAYLALADGNMEEAQVLFETLESEPEVAKQAKLGQALCLLAQDEPNLAIEICEEVLEEDPEEPIAYNLQGLGQLKRLQRFLAKRSFEQSLSLDPDQPAIQAILDGIKNL